MDIKLDCIYCTIKKADTLFNQFENDEQKKLKFMKEVFKIISTSENKDTSPYLSSKIMKLLRDELNLGDIYYEIKNKYNKLLLSMEQEVLMDINKSSDKLLLALKYAMTGNFIDFGAMDEVDIDKLKKIIDEVEMQQINTDEYYDFLNQLKISKEIVYIVDNCGEIVFDKVFIKTIKEIYPNINITVITRGKPIYNDATIEDAEQIGLSKIVEVIENGTDIPGTQLNKINMESKKKIDKADLIIAKGQGNFETLYGCGKNIFYIFLCKCDLFTKRFNMNKFQGIFINEKNVRINEK